MPVLQFLECKIKAVSPMLVIVSFLLFIFLLVSVVWFIINSNIKYSLFNAMFAWKAQHFCLKFSDF